MLFKPFTLKDKAGINRTKQFLRTGSGYMAEQATKPQTLGYCLADSPVGLLAWIYEKLVGWSDEYPWDDDEGDCIPFPFGFPLLLRVVTNFNPVLTWVSIFWFSRAGPAASLRIYFEVGHGDSKALMDAFLLTESPSIPLGLSRFPKEIMVHPKRCASS
jgi:hypothetical protein